MAIPLIATIYLPTVHSVIFNAFDGPVIRAAALQTLGAAGLSRIMLMVGKDCALLLCSAIALLACRSQRNYFLSSLHTIL